MATNDYIEKDLGIVTAYGEAVSGGYSGTRAEFQALLVRMANGILDYNEQSNKPSINGVTLQGNKTSADLNISTGTTNYTSLSNKPSINGVTLQGNKTSSDLKINVSDVEVRSHIINRDNPSANTVFSADCEEVTGKTPIGIVGVSVTGDGGGGTFSIDEFSILSGATNRINVVATKTNPSIAFNIATCVVTVLYA